MKVIIVGAGPSGLMCAYRIKNYGDDVILIDKNEKVGKKIYITGKGRCNVTNNCNKEDFFNNVVNNSKFLYSAYNNFTSQDTMEFFETRNVPLQTERGNRVFPTSYNAKDIAEALYKANKNIGVDIHLNETVSFVTKKDDVFLVRTNKGEYKGDRLVIATGGKSYSHTGSSGDGYKFAKMFGHSIIDLVPGLTSIKVKENIPSDLYKFTLKNVSLKVTADKFKHEEFGEITFYKEGVAGPIALTTSSLINRIEKSLVSLEIDFKPALSMEKLDSRLIREIQNKKNVTVNDLLLTLLPSEIIPWFLSISKINKDLLLAKLRKEEREDILHNLKAFKLTYDGLDDIDHAVVTSGGVNTKEINPKTMESKLVPGLYFIGEVIDVDAFTGGFNMQIAFSTGALAADNLK